jgi:hypothetical protein
VNDDPLKMEYVFLSSKNLVALSVLIDQKVSPRFSQHRAAAEIVVISAARRAEYSMNWKA